MACFLSIINGLKLCFCFRVIDVLKTLDQKEEEVDFYRKKFAGSQADRIIRAEAEAENVAAQLKKTKISGVLFHPFLLSVLSFEGTI